MSVSRASWRSGSSKAPGKLLTYAKSRGCKSLSQSVIWVSDNPPAQLSVKNGVSHVHALYKEHMYTHARERGALEYTSTQKSSALQFSRNSHQAPPQGPGTPKHQLSPSAQTVTLRMHASC